MILRRFSCMLLVVFLSGSVCAQDLTVSVILSKLESIRTTEKGGDELYLSVTDYASKAPPHNYLVPAFPMHWLSKYLKEIKNVVLWEKVVQEGEGVSIIFSLIEQDLAPWNLDDLIGTVKLKVRNEKGVLKKEWSIPNQQNTQAVKTHENEFILDGSGGEYHLFLKLEEKAGNTLKSLTLKEKEQRAKNMATHPRSFPGL